MAQFNTNSPQPDTRNVTLTITYKGRIYAICGNSQFEAVKNSIKERIALRIMADGKKVDEKELDRLAIEEVEKSGYSTLQNVLGRMTPDERERWKESYRFTPISKTGRNT